MTREMEERSKGMEEQLRPVKQVYQNKCVSGILY